nr:amidohydrolase family protein [Sphingomonas sp. Y57]
MAYDLKIRGATIVDGTGEPSFSGDVAISGGTIAAVGDAPDAAHRTIDADGALLTPGFIDPHTHYDGQAMWDDELVQSARHGITTAILGNCGVGFAPVAPGRQDDLVTLMAGVEDIPGTVLNAGLDWDWESFGDYLDRLDQRRWSIDIGAQVTHDPIRMYVMGERALSREIATEDDIARMRQLVSAALGAGAFGFSTGRNDAHRMADGRDTPASIASARELTAIAQCLRDHDYRVLQITSDFDQAQGPDAFDAEFALVEQMAEASGRPISLNLLQREGGGDQWRRVVERSEAASARGMDIRFQVAARGVGVLMGLTSSFHPFVAHPSFQAIAGLPLAELVRTMRDPHFRGRLLAEAPAAYAGKGNAAPAFFDQLLGDIDRYAARIFPDRGVPDFEAGPDQSLQADARRRDVRSVEAVYDALLDHEGQALLYLPIFNYGGGNLDVVREMLAHPQSMMGLGDAGAHVNVITDYSYPTFALSFWPYRRKAGPHLAVERVVRLMTGAPAAHFGLNDRGVIAPGRRADINLIDPDSLQLTRPRIAHDLPVGGQRLLQDSRGYLATLVKGTVIAERDELTGSRPGRLLRAG